MDHLKGILQAVQAFGLQRYPHDFLMIESPLEHSSIREEEGRVFHFARMGTLVIVILSLFLDFENMTFSQKPLYLCLSTLYLYLSPIRIDLICVTL